MTLARPFRLQGHRGARGLFPENTLEGFRAAWDLGVREFELDVGMTADDVVVVSHDAALNPDITRGLDGAWLRRRGPLLRDLRRSDLAAFDVGRIRPWTAYAAGHPAQRPMDGVRIPALTDVLRALPRAFFTVEIKTDPRHPADTASPAALAEAVLAAIDAAGASGRVMIESFDWRGPRHVRTNRPDMPLAWLTSVDTVRQASLWWDGVTPADHGGSVARAVAAEGGGTWAPHHATLTRANVAQAHGLGLAVLPWTVNRTADMRRLIGWHVDGLITDRPDRALRVMADVNTR